MFSRYIDNTYAPVVRKNLDRLIWGRLFSNACYRFAPPFIAVIARGLDVSVAQMGVALMIGEFAGLGSPILGRMVDKGNRVVSMTVGMIGITLAVVGAATSTTLVQFAISMFVMSGAKVLFDTSLIIWVNDHVPYERRGRIVGVIETSWALSLFIGVAAMGVATAVFSWRAGFAVGAIAMAISASFIRQRATATRSTCPRFRCSPRHYPAQWLFGFCSFVLPYGCQPMHQHHIRPMV
jgi:MFS family permease